MAIGHNLAKAASKIKVVDSKERVINIPLDKVVPDEEQVRKHFNPVKLQGLAKSIENNGVIHPIIVSPADKSGNYKIQKGERRWRASKIAGKETIKAIVNSSNESVAALLAGQIAENIHNEDLTPIELAEALNKLKGAKISQTEISEQLGKSSSWVSMHLSLLKAEGPLKELIENFDCEDATTGQLLVSWQKKFKAKCHEFAQACIKKKRFPTRGEVERAFEASKREKEPKPSVKEHTFKYSVPADRKESYRKLFDSLNEIEITDEKLDEIIKLIKS